MEGKGGGVFRNNYKGHIDKTKWGWNQGEEVGMAGVGGKCRQLYLNNNKINKKNNLITITNKVIVVTSIVICTLMDPNISN